MKNERARSYIALCHLMRVAGYLSVDEVAWFFIVELEEAEYLLARYLRNHPDAQIDERNRQSNKSRGGYF